jgi:hypothetical protein
LETLLAVIQKELDVIVGFYKALDKAGISPKEFEEKFVTGIIKIEGKLYFTVCCRDEELLHKLAPHIISEEAVNVLPIDEVVASIIRAKENSSQPSHVP